MPEINEIISAIKIYGACEFVSGSDASPAAQGIAKEKRQLVLTLLQEYAAAAEARITELEAAKTSVGADIEGLIDNFGRACYEAGGWESDIENLDDCRVSLVAGIAAAVGAGRQLPQLSGPRWRHIKRGTFYTEIARAELQAISPISETTPLVIYQGDDGAIWARPIAEFLDGRFERAEEPRNAL